MSGIHWTDRDSLMADVARGEAAIARATWPRSSGPGPIVGVPVADPEPTREGPAVTFVVRESTPDGSCRIGPAGGFATYSDAVRAIETAAAGIGGPRWYRVDRAFNGRLRDVPGSPNLDQVGGYFQGREAGPCEWFLWCDRAATGTMSHPVLGDVPICDRCRERAT